MAELDEDIQSDVQLLESDDPDAEKDEEIEESEPDPEKTVVKSKQAPKAKVHAPKKDDASDKHTGDATESDEESEDDEEKVESKADEEDSDEEDTEEEEPAKTVYDRPTVKEIKGKYPEFFKEFPTMRDAMFREAEYTSLFPTVEEARDAYEEVEAIGVIRDSALNGDPAPIFEAVEKTDGEAFKSLAKNLLPTLYKKSPDAYSAAITPVFENLIRQIYRDASKVNNEDLKNAALHLSNYIFDTDEVATGKKTFVKPEDTSADQRKQERDRELDQKFLKAYQEVDSQIKKNMMNLIRKDFDPDENFTPFLRRQLMDTVYNRISKQLELDEGHMSIMRGRWKHARANGFTDSDNEKTIAAFIARAKSLIPSVRAKVRDAALGQQKKASDKRKTVTAPKKELVGGGISGNGERPKTTKVDYSKMSDMDILNS